MALTVQEVIKIMEEWCPQSLAAAWDKVGLQVGHPQQPVERVLVTLDIDSEVVAAARNQEASLIICHHPLLFNPLENLRLDQPHQALVAQLVRKGLAVYVAHTNLDQAPGGTDDQLARRIGVEEVTVLKKTGTEELLKLVVYVPQGHGEVVRAALGAAGAGWIGNYSHCSFQVAGTGSFLPQAGSQPFVGKEGKLVQVPESRLETVVPRRILGQVLTALHRSHPYEEVAYDLFSLEQSGQVWGFGRIGTLSHPTNLGDFAQWVKSALGLEQVRIVGQLDRPVTRVATCAGSGGSLVDQAIAQDVDVLVTGDIKYHEAVLAQEAGLALVDAGHQGTETPIVSVVADYLKERLTSLDPTMAVDHFQSKTVFQWL